MVAIGLLAAAIIPAQMLIAGPIFRDRDTLPQLFAKGLRKIMGIKIEFNGAAIEKSGPMIYNGNHVSYLDPLIMGSFVKGAYVSKHEVSEWPVAGSIGRAVGMIFVIRNQNGKYIPEAQAQTIEALNKDRNVLVYPEATTSDGTDVLPFKMGVISVPFNNVSGVRLEKENVRMQSFAMRVTHIDGKELKSHDYAEDKYSWHGDNCVPMGEHFRELLKVRSVRIEVTALPVMDPKDYDDRRSFAAAARERIRKAL